MCSFESSRVSIWELTFPTIPLYMAITLHYSNFLWNERNDALPPSSSSQKIKIYYSLFPQERWRTNKAKRMGTGEGGKKRPKLTWIWWAHLQRRPRNAGDRHCPSLSLSAGRGGGPRVNTTANALNYLISIRVRPIWFFW